MGFVVILYETKMKNASVPKISVFAAIIDSEILQSQTKTLKHFGKFCSLLFSPLTPFQVKISFQHNSSPQTPHLLLSIQKKNSHNLSNFNKREHHHYNRCKAGAQSPLKMFNSYLAFLAHAPKISRHFSTLQGERDVHRCFRDFWRGLQHPYVVTTACKSFEGQFKRICMES